MQAMLDGLSGEIIRNFTSVANELRNELKSDSINFSEELKMERSNIEQKVTAIEQNMSTIEQKITRLEQNVSMIKDALSDLGHFLGYRDNNSRPKANFMSSAPSIRNSTVEQSQRKAAMVSRIQTTRKRSALRSDFVKQQNKLPSPQAGSGNRCGLQSTSPLPGKSNGGYKKVTNIHSKRSESSTGCDNIVIVIDDDDVQQTHEQSGCRSNTASLGQRQCRKRPQTAIKPQSQQVNVKQQQAPCTWTPAGTAAPSSQPRNAGAYINPPRPQAPPDTNNNHGDQISTGGVSSTVVYDLSEILIPSDFDSGSDCGCTSGVLTRSSLENAKRVTANKAGPSSDDSLL